MKKNQQLKLLLDTNIYGFIAKDIERIRIVDGIISNNNIIVYGNKIIRNELRDIPKKLKFEGRNVRIDILNLYDSKSMLAENALRAYNLVNSIIKKRTPNFIDYIQLKNYLRGGKSNELV